MAKRLDPVESPDDVIIPYRFPDGREVEYHFWPRDPNTRAMKAALDADLSDLARLDAMYGAFVERVEADGVPVEKDEPPQSVMRRLVLHLSPFHDESEVDSERGEEALDGDGERGGAGTERPPGPRPTVTGAHLSDGATAPSTTVGN